jgi:23S rRNA (cytidine1920-2'-O)/16S rRNA (cytidine1409-2'-O)-methyltransferase
VPRLDVVLVQRGLAETRERAHALILDGKVSVDDKLATRPAQNVSAAAAIAIREEGPDYVSRGALKLEAALDAWHIDPREKIALDVGASTGGFTDLLLQRGAVRVYAVDVGYGQLHYRLRGDPRVVSMERTNVRHLTELPEAPDLAVIDVSFISLRLALPPVFGLLRPSGPSITLIKPQFEAGREQVGKGGVVRDPRVHETVLQQLVDWSASQPWHLTDLRVSPIRGPAGNIEFLGLWRAEAPLADQGASQRALSAAAIISQSAPPAQHSELRHPRPAPG